MQEGKESEGSRKLQGATANGCLIFPPHLVLTVTCCTDTAKILKGIRSKPR